MELSQWLPPLTSIVALLVFAAGWKKVMTKEDCKACQASCKVIQDLKFSQGEKDFSTLRAEISGINAKMDMLIASFHRLEVGQAVSGARRSTDHHNGFQGDHNGDT